MLKIATFKINNSVIDTSFYWGMEIINHYKNLFDYNIPIYICCGTDTLEYNSRKFNNTNIMVVTRTNYSNTIDTDKNANKIIYIDNNGELTMSSSYIRKVSLEKINNLMDPNVLEYFIKQTT